MGMAMLKLCIRAQKPDCLQYIFTMPFADNGNKVKGNATGYISADEALMSQCSFYSVLLLYFGDSY